MALLVLLGKLGDTEDCEDPERHDNTVLILKYSRLKTQGNRYCVVV